VLEDVMLMRDAVKDLVPTMKIKSAGGVKTLDQLLTYMQAGVSRSGASATAAMLDEFAVRFTA